MELNSCLFSYQCKSSGEAGHPGPKGDTGESITGPEVIVSPTSLTVTQYQTATFYCSADGNPKPSISWSKTSGTGQGNKDGQGNKLQIRSADYSDSGSYVCTATNVLGKAMKVVKLLVEGMILLKEFFLGSTFYSDTGKREVRLNSFLGFFVPLNNNGLNLRYMSRLLCACSTR